MQVKVNREITMWVQDTYDVPDGTTKEEIKRLVESDEIFEFFEERDMYANIEIGDDITETGNYEIINTEQGNN